MSKINEEAVQVNTASENRPEPITEQAVSATETANTSETQQEIVNVGNIEVTDYEDKPDTTDDKNIETDNDGTSDKDADAEAFAAQTVKSRQEMIQERIKKEVERNERTTKRIATLSFWESLKSAQFEKKILTGTVVGIDTISEQNVAILLINGFRVLIPYAELYETPPVDTSTVRSKNEQSRREMQMMRRLLGAEIHFIITNLTGNPANISECAVIGSRKAAISRIAARNFNQRRPNGTAHINEGDIVEASIISVGFHGVYVNVYGKDVSIPQFKLTYKYINQCTDVYKTGDKIKVCIDKITYDEHGKAVKVEVSGKGAEEIDYIPRVQNIKEELVCMGRVTSVQQDYSAPGKLRFWLYLEGWNVPAIVDHVRSDAFVSPIQQGDKIVFKVKWIDKDNGLVRGNIISKA